MRNVFLIAKREWKSQRVGPAYYVVLGIFVILWEWLFFRNAFLVGEASIRSMFDLLPWILILLVPASTMGSVAGERESGTIELILTQPIKKWHFVLGKFLGVIGMPILAVLFAVPVAVSFALFGQLDGGVVIGQLLGSLGVIAVFGSVGLLVSSKLPNQIAALLITAVICFFLVIVGSDFVTAAVPLDMIFILERLSVVPHLANMARGAVDISDIWYFVSFTVALLILTTVQMTAGIKKARRIGIAIVVVALFLGNLLGQYVNFRFDLTANKAYTLSAASRKVLANLPVDTKVVFYASGKLPAQYLSTVRDIKDVLRDIQKEAKGRVAIEIKDPSMDASIATEAEGAGIQQIQFNVIGQEEFQVKTGYLGLVVSTSESKEVLAFVQDANDLEYQVVSNIKKLTTKDKLKIGFLSGLGGKNIFSDMRIITDELSKQFVVSEFSKEEEATDSAAIVVPGVKEKVPESILKMLQKFVAEGKGLLVLADTTNVEPQLLMAMPNENYGKEILNAWGVEASTGAVYDLQANETVRFGGQGGVGYLLPYPFWIRAAVSRDFGKIDSVVFPWATEILAKDQEKIKGLGFSARTIFNTTEFAGLKTGEFGLTPDQGTFASEGLQKRIVGIELVPNSGDKSGKVMVVGSSLWLTDQFVQNSPENLVGAEMMFGKLTNNETLAESRFKQRGGGRLMINQGMSALVKYVNFGLVIFILGCAYWYTWWRRKRIAKIKFS